MEDTMIRLRLESPQFDALCAGFEVAAGDPDVPIDVSLLAHVRTALADAQATAMPGLPMLVTLQSIDELAALAACFEVGGEGHADVIDDQWYSVEALLEQAAQPLRSNPIRQNNPTGAAKLPSS
jgi:hypothetical protein